MQMLITILVCLQFRVDVDYIRCSMQMHEFGYNAILLQSFNAIKHNCKYKILRSTVCVVYDIITYERDGTLFYT